MILGCHLSSSPFLMLRILVLIIQHELIFQWLVILPYLIHMAAKALNVVAFVPISNSRDGNEDSVF